MQALTHLSRIAYEDKKMKKNSGLGEQRGYVMGSGMAFAYGGYTPVRVEGTGDMRLCEVWVCSRRYTEKGKDMRLHGKRALITGSSRGIGRGIALKLAAQGVNVAVHYYQNARAAEQTLAQVRESGADGVVIQADIRSAEDISRMFTRVEAAFGKLDIFVSNARSELPTFYQTPLDISIENWASALDSQATAFLLAVRQAVRLMEHSGRIIAITYAPGARTGSWQPWVAMGSAKAALESLVRYFAVALAQRGITVNALSPGLTEDSVLNSLPPEVQERARAWHEGAWTPLGRLGTPADVGNAVALLCTDEASWITGQIIAVDGGASLMDTVLPPELQRG
jgi:enoyl-[acyl-carrier protein] reductase III